MGLLALAIVVATLYYAGSIIYRDLSHFPIEYVNLNARVEARIKLAKAAKDIEEANATLNRTIVARRSGALPVAVSFGSLG